MGFEPLTIGFDWEVGILNGDLSHYDDDAIYKEFALEVRRKYPMMPTGTDGPALLEHKSGIMRKWDELLERAIATDAEGRRIAKEKGAFYWPNGCSPLDDAVIGAHMHVGSMHSRTEAVLLRYAALPYMPAFIALMANSPTYRLEIGGWKSTRVHRSWVAENAEGFTSPECFVANRCGELNVWTWGKSTLEARSIDSVTSPHLLCECLVFLAGFLAYLVDQLAQEPREITQEDYQRYLFNRFRACRHGLQADFEWGEDGCIPVTQLLTQMLEWAEPYIKTFDVSPADFTIIPRMLEKRQNQADMMLVCATPLTDVYTAFYRYANLISTPDAFEEYLKVAPTLSSADASSPKDYILSRVQRDTRFWRLQELSHFSVKQLSQILQELAAEGQITVRQDVERGVLYSRAT